MAVRFLQSQSLEQRQTLMSHIYDAALDENLWPDVLAQFAKAVKESDEKQLKDHILLLCDKRHSFKTINDIVKIAALAGYPNFQFGVLKE